MVESLGFVNGGWHFCLFPDARPSKSISVWWCTATGFERDSRRAQATCALSHSCMGRSAEKRQTLHDENKWKTSLLAGRAVLT